MAVTESPKRTTEPVGSAASFTSTESSLPLSGRAPLAGESSDPAVQQLLAERNAYLMNRDLIDPPVDEDALRVVDEKIADVDDRLAELGFEQEPPATAKERAEQEKKAAAEEEKAREARRAKRAALRTSADKRTDTAKAADEKK